ncbi:hypothetical protein [Flavitalea sp.]|nr:hypothetical protein [Flavitalea sp.]
MADRIPIDFEYKGKDYHGEFMPVQGSGNPSAFQLIINNYYIGNLRYSDGWVFDGHEMNEMAEEFGAYITAWYQ